MKRLIIDAGSTKTEWIMMEQDAVVDRLMLDGYNPNYADASVFEKTVQHELNAFPPDVDTIHYYGSGCGREANRNLISTMLKSRFPKALIEVDTDMMGAARALFGKHKGVACILGTGVNSCLYDGTRILDRAVSLGYVVGDEGSGCYIGKKLVRAYFYDLMPIELKLQFEQFYHLEINGFIKHTYHEQGASRYLAGFARFAGDHLDHPFVQDLIKECFDDFIEVFVKRYEDCHAMPVSFVGSVAFYLQDPLRECLEANGLTLGMVRKSPAEGLVLYHSNDVPGFTH